MENEEAVAGHYQLNDIQSIAEGRFKLGSIKKWAQLKNLVYCFVNMLIRTCASSHKGIIDR